MEFRISSRRIMIPLIVVFIILLLASAAGQIYRFTFNGGQGRFIVDFFSFDQESNLPTYFETLLFLSCFLLLTVIAFFERKNNSGTYAYWFSLGIVFLFLSADEMLRIHEQFNRPIRELLSTSDYFYLAWTIPAIIFCFVLGIIYLRFLLNLEVRFRMLFTSSGLLFVSGAIAVEIFGSSHQFKYGRENLNYSLFTTIEESLEMIGLLLFAYSLLKYIEVNYGFLVFKTEETRLVKLHSARTVKTGQKSQELLVHK